jgi:hypothetical protein
MRTWSMVLGLTLAMHSSVQAAAEAVETPPLLVAPAGFCPADGSHPADAKVTALFKKTLESVLGGKLLSLYRFCPGSPTTAGLVAIMDQGAFEGSADSFVSNVCAQFKAIKVLAPPDMDQITSKIDKIAKEELGQGMVMRGLHILSAVLDSGVCYAFVQPEGPSGEPVMEILSYVPIRNKVIMVLRVYGVTGPSVTTDSYRHLQQTIAALQRANP